MPREKIYTECSKKLLKEKIKMFRENINTECSKKTVESQPRHAQREYIYAECLNKASQRNFKDVYGEYIHRL